MSEGILIDRQGSIARLTLNRPEVGNALDIPMARALLDACIACDEDRSIRCVVLTGAGRLFCSGGDVAAFNEAGERLPIFLKEITSYVHAAVTRLVRMNKPVVGAINGPTAGAGIGLALLGDIVLADPSAHFTLAYTGIGLSPDGGATWLLPRLVGLRRAQELCLRNRRVKAPEAMEIGLITRVSAEGRLMEETQVLAEELAASATSALGTTRQLLLESATTSLETQLESESRGIAAQARTREGREGIAAFIEKRKANFAGDSLNG